MTPIQGLAGVSEASEKEVLPPDYRWDVRCEDLVTRRRLPGERTDYVLSRTLRIAGCAQVLTPWHYERVKFHTIVRSRLARSAL